MTWVRLHPQDFTRVSVDEGGKYLFSAEYSGSWFEVFPILPNGWLGPAVFQMQTIDNVGPTRATNAPPGSLAFSAHEGPNGHPHQMESDPSNQWVVGTDAGQDQIYVWEFPPGGIPPLSLAAIPFVYTPPGDGPGTSRSTRTGCGCTPFKKRRRP